MERYSSYKDSGVSWIGEIPSHWTQRRVRYTGKSRNGLTYSPYDVSEDGEGILVLRSSNIQDGKLSFNDNVYVKKDIPTDLMVKKGDILICSRNGSRDLVGKLALIDKDLEASFGAFMMIYRTNMWAPFMEKVLSVAIQSYKTLFSTSTINQLTNDIFKDFVIPLPPLDEQEKIVSYLEDKTSKIDAYVADKEKEIELLQELKQKTIADAVTKGLNPDAKMKNSGISWIGEIPEHWEVKRIASLFTGRVQANTDFKYHHAFKFYYGTLVPKNEVGDFEEYRDTYVKYSVLQKDDIMINGLNLNYDFVSQRVAIAPSDGIITSAYVVARPRKGTNALYYNYLFKTMDNMKLFHGMGTGIRLTLSFDEMKKQVVVVPPQDEQQAIVAYIEEKCEKIDKLASELQSEIDYLKEYKQRLIADCVTGQVNVQNEI